MFCTMVNVTQSICTYTYGFLIYEIQYRADAQNFVSDKLAAMNLVAQLVSVPLYVILARVILRGIKVWKLMLTNVVLGAIA